MIGCFQSLQRLLTNHAIRIRWRHNAAPAIDHIFDGDNHVGISFLRSPDDHPDVLCLYHQDRLIARQGF